MASRAGRQGLLRWRNPDVIDAPFLELRDVLVEPGPVFLVGGHIPFEALQHRHVLRGGLLFLGHLEAVPAGDPI